ncbi:MAG: halocyanin domain-containing protein [Halobacteriota archaeon]
MKRREFMRTAGGSAAAATAVAAGSGTAAAQEEQPDWGGYLDGIDGGYQDLRGQDEVTVSVGAEGNGGALAFEPAGIWIDPGTTVVWEWTGEGGEHNVVTRGGPAEFESPLTAAAGDTFEFEFTEDHEGITEYACEPHEGLGMLGAVAVGEVDTVEAGGAEGGAWPEDIGHVGVPLQKHFLGIITFLGLGLTFVFTFYVLKYGESANTGRGQ